MRLLVLGTGPFAVPMFRSLLESTHKVLALVTRPIPISKLLIPGMRSCGSVRESVPSENAGATAAHDEHALVPQRRQPAGQLVVEARGLRLVEGELHDGHVGIGKDHRTDVPAFQHHPARLFPPDAPLLLHQDAPHGGQRGKHTSLWIEP